MDIPHLLDGVSREITLGPGDIIGADTHSGVGMDVDPPGWLQHDDTVECEIEGVDLPRTSIRGRNCTRRIRME